MSQTAPPSQLSALEEILMKAKRTINVDDGFKIRDSFHTIPGDVIICTPMKSGTAWLQQICHQLRTGGHEDFDDIDIVVPRIPSGKFDTDGSDLNGTHDWTPRMFAGHDSWDAVHKPAKYICCVRDPADVCYSAYNFVNDIWGVPKEKWEPISFWHNFCKSDKRSFYNFLPSWWPRRTDEDVLWLSFEDLKKDLRFCVREIAKFLEIPLTQNLEDLVCDRASFKYMSDHKSQFDAHTWKVARLPQAGMKIEGAPSVGRTREGGGQIGQGKERLPQEVIDDIYRKWNEEILPITGYSDYASMCAKESLLNGTRSK